MPETKRNIMSKLRSLKYYTPTVILLCAATYTGLSILIHYDFGQDEKLMHAFAYYLPLIALALSFLYVYLSKKHQKKFCVLFQSFEVLPDIVCISLAAVVLQDMKLTGLYLILAYLLLFVISIFLFSRIHMTSESENNKEEIEKLQSQKDDIQKNINKHQDEKDKAQNIIDDLQVQKNKIQSTIDALQSSEK